MRGTLARADAPRDELAPGRSGEVKEGRGSAPNPARGLCPLDPHQRQRPLDSLTGSVGRGRGRGGTAAGGVRHTGRPPPPCPHAPFPSPHSQSGVPRAPPLAGFQGAAPLGGVWGEAPAFLHFARLPWSLLRRLGVRLQRGAGAGQVAIAVDVVHPLHRRPVFSARRHPGQRETPPGCACRHASRRRPSPRARCAARPSAGCRRGPACPPRSRRSRHEW